MKREPTMIEPDFHQPLQPPASRPAANDADAQADVLRVGIGTTMIEPALTGGHLDGIGVYPRARVR